MAGYLLLESGSKILTEQGVDALLLENATSVVTVGTVTVAVRGLTTRFKVRGLRT